MEICNDDSGSVALAAEVLSGGGVIVVPTDTVYGLAALPAFPRAVDRIFTLKDRARDVNLPIIIGEVSQLDQLGVAVPPVGRKLAETFWPGALTIAFGFGGDSHRDDRPAPGEEESEATRGTARPEWLAGRVEVAVRLPDHPFLQQLAAKVGPMAVTSSNRHGQPTATKAHAATESLTELPDLLVDGGTLSATPSTLVNVRSSPARVEREGAIGLQALIAVAGTQALSQEI